MIEIIPNLHPVFVHFPIVLATAALTFTVIGALLSNKPYAALNLTAGRWMLWGAVLFALIAVVFGWFAYNSVEHDEISHAAMTVHRNWALGTLAAWLALLAWDVWCGRTGKKPTLGFLVSLIVAWLLVMTTAWHGGELVYRYGLGVMSLPKAEGAGHDHPHAHGDMQMPDAAASHEGGHTHSHDESAQVESPSSSMSATDITGTTPRKVGHTHAPETPPHKD